MSTEESPGAADITMTKPDPGRDKGSKGPKNREKKGKGPDQDKVDTAVVGDKPDGLASEVLPIADASGDLSAATEDTPELAGGAEAETSPRTAERRMDEVSLVVTRTLLSEATKRLTGPDSKPRMPENEEEGLLFAAQQILTREKGPGDANILEFKRSADPSQDLWMPGINKPDRKGQMQSFAEGTVRLAGILESTSDGRVVCYLEGKDGRVILDSGGPDDTGDNRLKITLTREEILRMQMHSEKDGYGEFFTGESQQVFKASMGEVPYDESLDPAIEAAAKASDMLTAEDIKARIAKLFPDGDKMPEQAKTVLKSLEGKTVIAKQDFLDAMSLGTDPLEQFAKAADEISAKIADLKNGDENNAPAAAKLEQLLAEQQLINTAYQTFKEASAAGKDPFDAYFDKVQNGQLSPEQAKAFIKAFKEGNDDAIADQIVELQIKEGMSEEDKAKVQANREVFKKALSAGELATTSIGIAALLLLVLGSAIIQMAPSFSGGGRR